MFDQEGRCFDCDGHFRHFPGCNLYVGESALSVEQRVEVYALVEAAVA